MQVSRAYALLEVKDFDADTRTIRGIATTPTPDRSGDVIDPLGVTFTNPVPLLLHHDKTAPVGTVVFDRPTADGVTFTATLPQIAEPGALKNRVDEAWQSIKAGMLRAVSIGFRPAFEFCKQLKSGGLHVGRCEVCELSLVTIPANREATIQLIKSLDAPYLAATGRNTSGDTDPASRKKNMTTSEQITAFENTRAAKSARMVALMQKAADESITLDADQTTEYDGLKKDIDAVDAHLVRLRDLEKLNAQQAKPVAQQHGQPPITNVIQVKSQLPKGTGFTRYAMAIAASGGNKMQAIEYAKQWESSTPEVMLALKAAVAPGNTTDATWAGPLVTVQNLASEFMELLRPATIIGRIPSLRRVPFNVSIPTQTAGGSYGWVGQAKPKPVTKLGFAATTLGFSKAAGIIVITDELARFSSPSAEEVVRNDMIKGIAQFLDHQFIDEAVAPVANVHPGSITNGITPLTAAATGVSPFYQFMADLNTLVNAMIAAGISLQGASLLTSSSNAFALSMGLTQAQHYPGALGGSMTSEGGNFSGLTIIASEAVGARLILVAAPYILLADDGGVTLDVSKEASLQMDSAPMDPADATSVYVSLWQNNLIGLRAERYINWKRTLDPAVQWMNGVSYHLSASTPFGRTAPEVGGPGPAGPGRAR